MKYLRGFRETDAFYLLLRKQNGMFTQGNSSLV